ncbi:hypothetical protein JCM21142_83204 [Saccharicrinis fermentans DSM 9555 = JCM 21142]|uniref:Secretion system C-terminal sorting domain-containing protein n=2 Tax=Saccharicrinis fermentans TaxID=982 RepID=W7YJ38_9BACT|nr:hypothetical protein JCM21142_83204 [Saccharicrinis fermentans DSM 9555 = JCM 21142]
MMLCFLLGSIHASAVMAPTSTIEISGPCITGTIVLYEEGVLDGKAYYTGTGTIWNYPNVSFAIHWDMAESKWFLSLSGQPFWYNEDDTNQPNSTLLSGNWTQAILSEGSCDVVIQGSATNLPTPTSIETTTDEMVNIYAHQNTINVSIEEATEASITVFDISGHKVKEMNTSDKKNQINDLPNGIYIIKVKAANKIATEKVILKD